MKPRKRPLCVTNAAAAVAILSVLVVQALDSCHALSSSPPRTSPPRSNVDPTAPTDQYAPHMRSKIASSVAKGERRANERSAQSRSLCSGCSRPSSLCICSALPRSNGVFKRLSTANTDILILQHKSEFRRKNFSTVPLIKLVLEDVTVKVGYEFDADTLGLKDRPTKPLLLYPGPTAVDLIDLRASNEDVSYQNADTSPTEGRDLLILIDGTWGEAKRIVRESPSLLDACQHVQFSSTDAPSVYNAVRKEPEDHCLSTLEACARALVLLEPTAENSKGGSVITALEKVLDKHIQCHLTNALEPVERHDLPSTKIYEKNRRRKQIENTLFKKGDGFVESNSDMIGAEEEEIIPIKTLDDGAIIRSLQRSDALLVDEWWEHSSTTSLPMIMRCIGADRSACLGVEINGELVAFVLRYLGGALGMLYVDPSHRRQGYGAALLNEATRAVEEQNESPWSLILVGNEASEALFTAHGWEKENPKIKNGSGKRRSNRKWIKAASK